MANRINDGMYSSNERQTKQMTERTSRAVVKMFGTFQPMSNAGGRFEAAVGLRSSMWFTLGVSQTSEKGTVQLLFEATSPGTRLAIIGPAFFLSVAGRPLRPRGRIRSWQRSRKEQANRRGDFRR